MNLQKIFFLFAFYILTSFVQAHEYKLHNIPKNLTETTYIVSSNSIRISYILSALNDVKSNHDPYIKTGINFLHDPIISQMSKDLSSLTIHFWLFNEANTTSFSNAQKNCQINFSNSKDKIFLINDIKKDVFFTLSHEIGHCVLGKEALIKMNWQISLTPLQEQKFNNYIQKQTSIAFNHQDLDKLPLIAYHEIFADTFATLWLYHQNIIDLKDIELIANKRKNDFTDNSPYISYIALENFILLSKKGIITPNKIHSENIVKLAQMLSQQAFITYLVTFD